MRAKIPFGKIGPIEQEIGDKETHLWPETPRTLPCAATPDWTRPPGQTRRSPLQETKTPPGKPRPSDTKPSHIARSHAQRETRPEEGKGTHRWSPGGARPRRRSLRTARGAPAPTRGGGGAPRPGTAGGAAALPSPPVPASLPPRRGEGEREGAVAFRWGQALILVGVRRGLGRRLARREFPGAGCGAGRGNVRSVPPGA